MAPPVPEFMNPDPTLMIVSFIVTIISAIVCLAIYFKTRESYELTRYERIKYFRNAFLFFGLAYILSILSDIAMFSGRIFGVMLPREIFVTLFILPLGYLSTMAILYLIFSTVWKKFENSKTIMISHIVAIILTIATFLTRSHLMLAFLQLILFILAIVVGIITSEKKKKVSHMKITYFLVLGLWLFNLFSVGRRHPMNPEAEILFNIVTLGIFAFVYYRIAKWTS